MIVSSELYYSNIKWITYKEFLEYEKLIIMDINEEISNLET